MQSPQENQISPPPGIIETLMAGFDIAANHLALALFPLLLDVWLWLGPHLRIRTLLQPLLQQMLAAQLPTGADPELYQAMLETWKELSGRVNLFALLRTYPIGIPSLMVARLPVENPLGAAVSVDVNSWLVALVLWSVFLLLGVLLGTLYFLLVSRSATNTQPGTSLLGAWAFAGSQMLLLTLMWMLALFFVFTPFSLLAVGMSAMGAIGQVALFITFGIALWMFVPLLFSAHGVFVHRLHIWRSIWYGVRVVRFTMPATSLFLVSLFVLSRGLDLLWSIPQETSWFTLVGLAGHAFIATALLASSFIYYQRAGQWVQEVLDHMQAAHTV